MTTHAPDDSGTPAGPPHRLAALMAVLALALSAITLVRAAAGPQTPRIPAAVEKQEAAVQAALDGADVPPEPSTLPERLVKDKKPIRPGSQTE